MDTLQVQKWVTIVKFASKKKVQYYVALIIDVNQYDELTIKMLKIVCNNDFTCPNVTIADDADLCTYEHKEIFLTNTKMVGQKVINRNLIFM